MTMGLRRLVLGGLPLLAALAVLACGAGDREPAAPAGRRAGGELTTAPPMLTTTSSSARTGSTASSAQDGGPTATTAPPDIEPVRYDGDFGDSVAPILGDKCAACHGPGGPGAVHWELATAGDVADHRDAIAEVVESGAMPPWPAGGDSPAFVGDRRLRPDQLRAVLAWAREGGPIDVDRATPVVPPGPVVGLADPDAIVRPARPYTGSTATADDYRCQIYDPELPDGGWITAYQFRPDRAEVVHHAIGYLIPADRRAEAEARDGEDGRPGWSCYGSSGLGRDEIFLGWAPGQDPTVMPEGSGLPIQPGAFIVVQIHYHFEGEAPADRSSLAIDLASEDELAAGGGGLEPIRVASLVAPAEIPCSRFEDGPLCDRDAAIAAARQKYGPQGVQADAILRLCRAEVADFVDMTDGTASSRCDIPAGLVGADGRVVSVLGHQHEIGAWFRMTLNPGRDDERVLLDIPDWDFDWQYRYVPVDPIVIEPDDVVRIECGWDRSRRDPELEPAWVLWADGTDDEMCFATVATRPA
jgi:mono/diheme cytochrome c family protein